MVVYKMFILQIRKQVWGGEVNDELVIDILVLEVVFLIYCQDGFLIQKGSRGVGRQGGGKSYFDI